MQMTIVGFVLIWLAITPRLLAEPSTQPAVAARAALEAAVKRWTSAERIAAQYRQRLQTFPETEETDRLVSGRSTEIDCRVYVRRPDRLDYAGGTFIPGMRFVFDGQQAFRTRPHGDVPILEIADVNEPDVDAVLADDQAFVSGIDEGLIWLLRSDGWENYFKYATDVRHIGWVRVLDQRTVSPFARIACTAIDGSSWEFWIDSEDTHATKRIIVRDKLSVNFLAPLPDQGGKSRDPAPIDLDQLKSAKAVRMVRTRELEFSSLEFNSDLPTDVFQRPEGELKERPDVAGYRPTSVGRPVPEVLGKDSRGKALMSAQLKDGPFVAIKLSVGSSGRLERYGWAYRHAASIAREVLNDPSAIVLLVDGSPDLELSDFLKAPEFASARMFTLDGSARDLFEGGAVVVVGKAQTVSWDGSLIHPLMFPEFKRALEDALRD